MNDIKVIIFDLDGTLYNLNNVVSMNYRMQVDFYSAYTGSTNEETVSVFEKNNIYPVMNGESKSATEFFLRTGISSEEWNTYRDKHFRVNAINKDTAVDSKLMEQFYELGKLVLLSSNSLNNIYKILNHISISKRFFSEIVCSDNKQGEGSFNKKEEMKLIAKSFHVSPKEMISIGDRYKTDIEPMLELGGKGVLIDNPSDLIKVYTALVNNELSDFQ